MPRTTKKNKKSFEQLYALSTPEERIDAAILMLARSQRTKAAPLQLHGKKSRRVTVSTETKSGMATARYRSSFLRKR